MDVCSKFEDVPSRLSFLHAFGRWLFKLIQKSAALSNLMKTQFDAVSSVGTWELLAFIGKQPLLPMKISLCNCSQLM